MHGNDMRGKLNTEITRKQFLQYMTAAALTVFGLNNLISLLTGNKFDHAVQLPSPKDSHGFGNSKFGV